MKHKEFSLQKYSVMAGVFIIMQNNSIAEVIYTDIEPDIILDEGGEAAELDMNDDGISDFFFQIILILATMDLHGIIHLHWSKILQLMKS